jgi:Tol biopolymer transport system component
MLNHPRHFSLADLAAAGIRLQPADAVNIAVEVITQVQHGTLDRIPSSTELRFDSTGRVAVEPGEAAAPSVEAAACLLDDLLPSFDDPAVRVPGALRIAIARARGTLDLPPYSSLDAFVAAVARFSSTDSAATVRALAAVLPGVAAAKEIGRKSTAVERSPLTISDVRRARRSTGLTLAEISERSRIPVSLLRELEWGYFVNWPGGHYGRTQLIRYARAAGLDDGVVMRAVWPVLLDALRARAAGALPHEGLSDARPVVEMKVVRVEPIPPPRTGRPTSRRALVLAAAAIPVVLGIAALPMLMDPASPDPQTAIEETVSQAEPTVPETMPGGAPPAGAASAGTAAENAPPVSPEPTRPVMDRGRRDAIAQPSPGVRPEPTETVGPRPAVLNADAAFSPTFATTGSAMFYHADAEGGSALMRADTDASGAVLRVTSIVDDSARNFHVRPSPDGQLIAFDSDREGERAVYVANVDGSAVRRVSGTGFAAVPSWSPDGRRLAFVRAEPERPRVWNLWTVDLDTGRTERLTSHRVGQPWGAAWFPDGQRIAYSHEDRLVVRALDGSYQRIYPSPREGRLLRTPAVSPDGKRIIFQLYRDGGWLLNLSDGSMRRILTDPTAEEFTWSPDGRRVAYHSRQTGDWNVWMMAAR